MSLESNYHKLIMRHRFLDFLCHREKIIDEKKVIIDVDGPVGSGKTLLIERLVRQMNEELNVAVITNDIYTKEDVKFLCDNSVLSEDRIIGVKTGSCPHTAIREDAYL